MSTYTNRPRPDVIPGSENTAIPKAPEGSLAGTAREAAWRAGQKVEDLKDETRKLAGTLKEGTETLKEKVTGGAELTGKRLRDTLGSCNDYVKKNPGKAILASIAVGWAMGALGRRNRKTP
jgi:ElaB/YqjD/DUF883 family membrane-anchored ribosome-binding protein